eukprot:jgi/Undpi1/7998/HiC_scaffold_24.g10470.m1
MGRKGKTRARKRARCNGQFQRREPAVAAPGDTPQPSADSLRFPLEVDGEPFDDDDDDWHDEDAGAASGAGQATLSFRSAAAVVPAAAVCTAQHLCPEIASPRRAAQSARPPCRQTVHRRKQAALGTAKQGMARFMSGWLESGAGQQPSSPQKPETEGAAVDMEEEESPVPAAGCSVEPRSDGESGSEVSDSDMLVCDGADLPLQGWVGEDDQKQAQEVLGEHCDGYLSWGDCGFLDGVDYTSELSDGSPHDGEENGAESDGDVEPRRAGEAAVMGAGFEASGEELDDEVEHGSAGEAAATGECGSGCATSAAAKQPAPAVRRSSRETSSKGI